MKTLTDIQIKQIADEIDCGFICYYNSVTGELLFIPDEDKHPDIEMDSWRENIKKINKNHTQFKTILPPDSSESFEIMVDFIKTLPENIPLIKFLQQALTRKKPFREFKFVIDNSGEYRQIWFDFKANVLQDHVRSQIESG